WGVGVSCQNGACCCGKDVDSLDALTSNNPVLLHRLRHVSKVDQELRQGPAGAGVNNNGSSLAGLGVGLGLGLGGPVAALWRPGSAAHRPGTYVACCTLTRTWVVTLAFLIAFFCVLNLVVQ